MCSGYLEKQFGRYLKMATPMHGVRPPVTQPKMPSTIHDST
jgi:hypothetical protein